MPHRQSYRLSAADYKLLMFCVIIAILGFFDFMIFWHSADFILSLFFSTQEQESEQYIYLLALFTAGYILRPLGGFWFGHYADKHGRKPALLLSLLGVSVFTLIMALLPVQSLGMGALLLFMAARLGQGIAFGAQPCIVWTYLCERLPLHSIGFACGLTVSGVFVSVLLMLIMLNIIDNSLTQQQLLNYGWRLPFLIGGLITLSLFFLTKKIDESPVFLAQQTKAQPPLNLKQRWQGIIPTMILTWFITSITTIMVFLLKDMIYIGFLVDGSILNIALVVCLVFLVIGCVFFGFLTDRTNAAKVLCVGCILFAISAVLLTYDLNAGGNFMLLSFALTGFFGGVIGAAPVMIVRLCPARHRLRTICTGYNGVVVIVAAAIVPLLNWLMYYTAFALSAYLGFLCMMVMFFAFYAYYLPRNKEQIDH